MRQPPYSDAAAYREWLNHPDGYLADVARMKAERRDPPREDWPLDVGALAQQHRAHADMCIRMAAEHMRKAQALLAGAST